MSGVARSFERKVLGIVKLLRTDLSAKPSWLLVVLDTSETSVDLGFPNLKNGASNKNPGRMAVGLFSLKPGT